VRRRKVAIVGGGAAGLVTAWLLDETCDVTVFEKAPILGGHVRTLGGNLPSVAGAPPLDAGVLLFEKRNFPTVHALFDLLGVRLRRVTGGTALHEDGCPSLYSPALVRMRSVREQPMLLARLAPLAQAERRFLRRAASADPAVLLHQSVGDWLGEDRYSVWLRLLLLYAWSTPWDETLALPATMAVPMLADFIRAEEWHALEGGAWTYLERILESLHAEIRTDVAIASIVRDPVRVQMHGCAPETFDDVVFATPPDQVLALLGDPTADEERRFAAWTQRAVTTLLHDDDGIYARRGIDTRSEFDLFHTAAGERGYNAWLDNIAGASGGYGLAHLLDGEIAVRHVLARVDHEVPRYTVAAVRWRDDVIAHQGEHDTWFAGAWLGEGLHEGAVRSASAVAEALGAAGIMRLAQQRGRARRLA
jgi:predicted NAD/FAD-binding protein